ncbi:NACHT domain-containing protein [Streptomyces chrestomyceticus]|uniref:NACHT domain-containing protein n=1 Tax=Streptomyces chrestomyceticus TaxID=68185 RepID=UPI0019CFE26A|nr:NACHT domain-containing protein [Streptomyces chrestomyceticus]
MAPGRRDDSGAASRHVDQRAKARWFSGILQAGGDISVNVFGWDRRTPAAWADALAAEIAKHWQREYRLRLLGHPLSVRWRPAAPELVQPWDSLAALVGTWPGRPDDLEGRWAAGPGELAGEKRLVDVLRRIPTRRLIVLGEPGTGKTILLVRLVLDLLSDAERTAGAPVPFLTSLSSWDPVQQELDDLLEQRLIVDFKGLHRRVAGGVHGRRRRCTLARALLQEHLVLPVLDGLDELPEHLRGMAVNRINEALGGAVGASSWPRAVPSFARRCVRPTASRPRWRVRPAWSCCPYPPRRWSSICGTGPWGRPLGPAGRRCRPGSGPARPSRRPSP